MSLAVDLVGSVATGAGDYGVIVVGVSLGEVMDLDGAEEFGQ